VENSARLGKKDEVINKGSRRRNPRSIMCPRERREKINSRVLRQSNCVNTPVHQCIVGQFIDTEEEVAGHGHPHDLTGGILEVGGKEKPLVHGKNESDTHS